jgi:hypothetical protein
MTDAGLMGKASIDWDHLDADDHENLEKLTAPYWAIDEARGKGQGEIGRPALRVLEAFFVHAAPARREPVSVPRGHR